MSQKNLSRLRRARQTRLKIREVGAVRLTVHRTNTHIYAQITSPSGDKVLAAASSLDKDLEGRLKTGADRNAATEVGKLIAARALAAGVKEVVFDRGGYMYHGRIAALANAAREGGLSF